MTFRKLFRFDPSIVYGRTRATAQPKFQPHFALYDQKCLTFKAFFKQSVPESPDEHFLIRQVNIIYFLEDDSITVMEPFVPVSCAPCEKIFHVRHCMFCVITCYVVNMCSPGQINHARHCAQCNKVYVVYMCPVGKMPCTPLHVLCDNMLSVVELWI